MNDLTIFNYQDKEIRTILKDGEPWFVAKDVCDYLEISNSRDAISNISDNWKASVGISDTSLSTRKTITMQIINESAVYKLVFRSRKPEAEKFTDWLAKEVIPSIRKNGLYAADQLLDNPDFLIKIITKLKKEREMRINQEKISLQYKQIVSEYETKVEYYDFILQSQDTLTITQIAKDYGLSGNQLNKILHDNGLQYKESGQWLLYQNIANKGYTRSETITYKHSNGSIGTRLNTKWTQKGRLKIHEVLKELGIQAEIDKDYADLFTVQPEKISVLSK